MSSTTASTSISTGASIQAGRRPRDYYIGQREDVAQLIPATAKKLLEIGCGDGNFGRMMRARGHSVAGVELVPEAAERAKQNMDEVVCGDIETMAASLREEIFDALVFADVLEHMVDPWRVLGQLAKLLRPGGIAVASIPNVQNHRVVRNLLRGKWEYTDSGLMDRGHMRFFTWEGIVGLFNGAGLDVVDRRCLYNLKLRRRIMMWLTFGKIEPFLVRQYLVVGRKPETQSAS